MQRISRINRPGGSNIALSDRVIVQSVVQGESNSTQTPTGGLRQRPGRVCDRCISNKIKCDLKKPTCSRCAEGAHVCVYSSKKRKPGPAKGSRRGTFAARSLPEAAIQMSEPKDYELINNASSQGPYLESETTNLVVLHDLEDAGQIHSSPQQFPGELFVEIGEEKELLQSFFEQIQPAIPLFARTKFFERYESGSISRSLILVIIAITAKLFGRTNPWSLNSLDAYIEYLLASTHVEETQLGQSSSLDHFRKNCLIAYYEFHQHPGERAWMRIGRLTRQAYRIGLNQIENPQACLIFLEGFVTDDDVEEWRYVWWCIYCFDSYSNLATGTPFLIEEESIRTALPDDTLENVSTNWSNELPRVFLFADSELLWKNMQEIRTNTRAINFNIHIITTSVLRKAGSFARLAVQNPTSPIRTRIAALGSHLSALRLALPLHHLRPARNVMMNETSAEHHMRLTTVLHLHLARIFISLPLQKSSNEVAWADQWQEVIGSCQNIASVVAEWDNQFSPSVDPALCFIVFTALLLLKIQDKCIPNAYSKHDLNHCEEILSLFLEHFSNFWSLPRELLISIDRFSEAIPCPLIHSDVERILGRFTAPLHPQWLHTITQFPEIIYSNPIQDFSLDIENADF